jgi:hypothetical protein
MAVSGTVSLSQINVSAAGGNYSGGGGGGLALIAAVLGWFYCLARGRMAQGLQRALEFGLSYGAQTNAYLLVLTDAYPNADPAAVAYVGPPAPPRPVRVRSSDDGRRGRWTVFFRFFMALPHLMWLYAWAFAVFFAWIAIGFAALVRGRAPAGLHRFLAAYVRYQTHVLAYLNLLSGPFPDFNGRPGYAVDAEIDPPAPQPRAGVFFRGLLVAPAFLLGLAFSGVLFTVGFLSWWVSLFTGEVPEQLRRLGGWALDYMAQAAAYGLILTSRYPYTGPA